MDPSLLTFRNVYGQLHPGTQLFQAPIRLEPCAFRWSRGAHGQTDYRLESMEDLHQMALCVLDAMAEHLHVPPTLDYYQIPPEEAAGRYSALDHQWTVDEADYERFQAIRRARHAPLAWWWLQRNRHFAEGGVWGFEFIPLNHARDPLPVPASALPSPITWLTAP